MDSIELNIDCRTEDENSVQDIVGECIDKLRKEQVAFGELSYYITSKPGNCHSLRIIGDDIAPVRWTFAEVVSHQLKHGRFGIDIRKIQSYEPPRSMWRFW